jgi:hypothetical protein
MFKYTIDELLEDHVVEQSTAFPKTAKRIYSALNKEYIFAQNFTIKDLEQELKEKYNYIIHPLSDGQEIILFYVKIII